MFYVYILYSEKFDKFYVGQTNDFTDRLRRHNSKQVQSTAAFVPWTLKCLIEKETRSEAVILELKLKNLSKQRLEKFTLKNTKPGPDEA